MPHLGELEQAAVLPASVAPTVTASPFSYVAPSNGFLSAQGGTLTGVTYTRNGVNTALGTAARLVSLRRGDTISFGYSAAPTVTFFADGV